MNHVCRNCGHETIVLSVPCALCGSSDIVGAAHAVALPVPFAPAATAPATPTATAYFHVSPWKLAIMSTATFSLYQFYWAYMQWRQVRAREGGISPFWRTLFFPIFAYSLFRRVREDADKVGVKRAWSAGYAAFGFITITFLLSRLPDPFWLLRLLSVLPLAAVQETILKVHGAKGLPAVPSGRYSGWDVAGLSLGTVWWIFVVRALFIPDEV